ncbi:MAG: LysM peptidoglycan-binding domain-containing protein [Alphaproteobacteria bacterium]
MNRFVIIGLFGVVVIVAAIGLNDIGNKEEPSVTQPSVSGPEGANQNRENYLSKRDGGIPVPTPPPVARYRPGDPRAQLNAVLEKKTAVENAAVEARPGAPKFDVVRVNPQGDSVIAGRAEPGAEVRIYDGDKLAGSVIADKRGEWVFLPTEPLPPGDRALRLVARNPDGAEVASESVVVLAVPAPASRETGDAVIANARSKQPLAVLVPDRQKGPSRVLQTPNGNTGPRNNGLSLDIVDYDEQGDVSVAGKGESGAIVRLYVDNKAVGETTVLEDGQWRLPRLSWKIEPGVYTLRADQIVGGRVVARVETPFSRAEISPPSGTDKPSAGNTRVVVQPGNSLWRIARRTLGDGVQYTVIYEANKKNIRDPDLIFPGQVFDVPVVK